MEYLESLVDALRNVTDRLALHVEYDKYDDVTENWKDRHALRFAESTLEHTDGVLGVRMLLAMTSIEVVEAALINASERLRLHTVLHPYDAEYGTDAECEVSENDADLSALDDANSVLLNNEENNTIE